MSDYDGLAQHTWADGDDCLRINVFAEDSVSRNHLDVAYDAVEDAVSDVYYDDYNAGNVDYAEVAEYDTTENLPCSGSSRYDKATNIRDHVNDWLDDHGFSDSGCYLWVTNCGVARGWDGGWSGRAIALVSADWYGYPDSYLGAMAVQESFHSFINHDCDDVQSRTDGNEHDLGSITTDDEVTPMAASYEDSKKYHQNGNCSGQNPDYNSYTNTITPCTTRAVSDSLEHKNVWFHDW